MNAKLILFRRNLSHVIKENRTLRLSIGNGCKTYFLQASGCNGEAITPRRNCAKRGRKLSPFLFSFSSPAESVIIELSCVFYVLQIEALQKRAGLSLPALCVQMKMGRKGVSNG